MKNLLFVSLLAISGIAFSQNGEDYSLRPLAPEDHFHNPYFMLENGEEPGKDLENSFLSGPDVLQSLILPPVQLFDTFFYWKLDTSINEWVNKRRYIDYIYDSDSHLPSVTIQKWDGMQWVDSSQIIRTYDADRLTYVLVKEKIDTTWQNNYSNIYSYDQGLQTSLLVQDWVGSGWVNSWRETRSYDLNGNLEVFGREVWNDSTYTWDQGWQYLYTYDDRGNLMTEVRRSWVLFASQWAYGQRQLYTYNDSNRVTSHTTQQSHGYPEWGNEDLELYTYDTLQNVISVVTQKWDSSGWSNVSQQLSAFDFSRNRISLKVQSWMNSKWADTDSVSYAYDDDNNPIDVRSKKWSNGAWTDSRHQVLEYGGNHSLRSHMIWRWINSGWAINFSSHSMYDDDLYQTSYASRSYSADGTILLSGDSTYTYYKLGIATDESSNGNGQASIYPNPCNGQFSVNCAGMEALDVYTLTGRKVYGLILSKDQTSVQINLTGQAAGIYIVIWHDGNDICTHKIVIQ